MGNSGDVSQGRCGGVRRIVARGAQDLTNYAIL
jgi:hypothetical protein